VSPEGVRLELIHLALTGNTLLRDDQGTGLRDGGTRDGWWLVWKHPDTGTVLGHWWLAIDHPDRQRREAAELTLATALTAIKAIPVIG
jgi:hypothetical protein